MFIASSFDPSILIGLGTAPALETIVQFLKEYWSLPSKLAPIAAIVLGIGINAIIGYLLNWDVKSILAIGIISGAGASGWHQIKK